MDRLCGGDEQLNRARQVLFSYTEGKNAYPDAVVELAMVQLGLGQYKAELTSRRAVELDEKSGRAFLALGTALDAQNYHEQAEVAFRRGVDNWKGRPCPYHEQSGLEPCLTKQAG